MQWRDGTSSFHETFMRPCVFDAGIYSSLRHWVETRNPINICCLSSVEH